MRYLHLFLLICAVSFLLMGCKSNDARSEKTAPLFDNLGSFHYKVTTDSELAQKYFDQGITLTFGFNHREAFRSFYEVTLLDSNCAMGYWGMALVLGPNINAPMETADINTAYDAIQKAIKFSSGVSEKEKDFIMALSERYTNETLEDRSHLDIAYADAMRKLYQKYPDDVDAATIFAESLMDLHPWDYWLKDGTPQPWANEIITVLEGILEKDENHPGANHLYIHCVEASKNPQRGLPSADRLRTMIPGAGHLVHMPAHIYIRVGQYHDGSLANELAVKSDEEYLTQCYQQGLYPLAYYPHNYHFLWATATLEGASKKAIDAAIRTSEKPADSLMNMCGYQTLQHYYSIPYYAYVRFGKWDEILKMEEPKEYYLYPKGIYHYARGMAFTAKNQIDEAEKELKNLNKLKDNENVNKLSIWGINSAGELLKIASDVLAGEIAAKNKNYSEAVKYLKKAVAREDMLRYDEPSTWYHSVRHNLGAVLLADKKFKDAEKIYKEDLENYPENGWALFGLIQALKAQNKTDEVKKTEERFEKAWQYADFELSSSRII